MPGSEDDLWELMQMLKQWGPAKGVVEKVGGFIQGNPAPGSAMFNFGMGYGAVRMAMVGAGIPFCEVTPQAWQKYHQVARHPQETKSSWKNRLKTLAQSIYPDLKVTLRTADALLLALFLQKMESSLISS